MLPPDLAACLWRRCRVRRDHVDDLAVLIDSAVYLTLCTGDVDVSFVNKPPIPDAMAAWPGCSQTQKEAPCQQSQQMD